VVALWARLLKVERVGIDDNFFALGGKSLLALQVVNAINKQFGSRLSMVDVFRYPTIGELMTRVDISVARGGGGAGGGLVQLQKGKPGDDLERIRLFLIHPISGEVLCYDDLVNCLDSRWDVYGVQMTEPHRHTVEELARHHVALLRSVQPKGPYHVAGYSFGGTIAYEMACQLRASGQTVGSVSLIDASLTHETFGNEDVDFIALAVMLHELWPDPSIWGEVGPVYRIYGVDRVLQQVLEQGSTIGALPSTLSLDTLRARFQVYRSHWDASRRYAGTPHTGDVRFLGATVGTMPWEKRGWERLARFERAPALHCDHFQILEPPQVGVVAAWMTRSVSPEPWPLAELDGV
jgi:thioesterase domain-containing protein/acyl carrier protein